MQTVRLFIDLPIDQGLCQQLLREFSGLNLPWAKLRVNRPENMHLTLKFLGDTAIENVPLIIDALDDINSVENFIELNINSTKIFGKDKARTLTLSLANSKKLQKLFETIDQKLFERGLAHKETRQYSAHITLARVKNSALRDEFKDFLNWNIDASSTASYFELQESKLEKTGPIHTVMQTFEL